MDKSRIKSEFDFLDWDFDDNVITGIWISLAMKTVGQLGVYRAGCVNWEWRFTYNECQSDPVWKTGRTFLNLKLLLRTK